MSQGGNSADALGSSWSPIDNEHTDEHNKNTPEDARDDEADPLQYLPKPHERAPS